MFRRPATAEIPAVKDGNAALLTRRELPKPVTMDRVSDELRKHNYAFSADDDGDLTGVWDNHQFWFILGGNEKEVLQVRGRWNNSLGDCERVSALLAVNDWNRDHIWPKAYVRDEGELVVYAEVSIDFEYGVTDSQLREAIACGLVTSVQFFNNFGSTITASMGL
ncbi:MAG: YbjN domain-containing protein [Cellulomonadaceae bacterium]|nr:YbjN domain-containing protein [Cellulomonadaceae bacterium]